jgi:histidine triad (HIT) family protein
MKRCIFCQIVRKELLSTVVYEDDQVFAFEDIDPQAPVHVLIIPKKHIATLMEVPDQEEALMGRMVLVAKKIATLKNVHHRGFRLVINCNPEGGQSVYHLHLHLLGGRGMRWPPG